MKPHFSPSCDGYCMKLTKWQMLITKQTWLPNDKTIIELAYCKTSPNSLLF